MLNGRILIASIIIVLVILTPAVLMYQFLPYARDLSPLMIFVGIFLNGYGLGPVLQRWANRSPN